MLSIECGTKGSVIKMRVAMLRCVLLLVLAVSAHAQPWMRVFAGGLTDMADASKIAVATPAEIAWVPTGAPGVPLTSPDAWSFIVVCQSGRVMQVFSNGTLKNVIGNGEYAFSGTGYAAVDTPFYQPMGVAYSTRDNSMYIADAYGCVIRKVNSSGIVLPFAGYDPNVCFPDSGGSPAASSGVGMPTSISVDDTTGVVYFADFGYQNIFKVSATGILVRLIGNNGYGFSGDGGPASAAVLYVPTTVAYDTVNRALYIADTYNHRIRCILQNDTIITVAGSGLDANTGQPGYCGDGGPATSACLSYPTGIAVDGTRNMLWIADTNNQVIRVVWPNGTITRLAGVPGAQGYVNGPALTAQFSMPTRVSWNPHLQQLAISDEVNNVVRMLWPDNTVTTVAGNGGYTYSLPEIPAGAMQMYTAKAVAIDPLTGSVYVADASCTVGRIDANGIVHHYAGRSNACGMYGNHVPATTAALNYMTSLHMDVTNRTLYIADYSNHMVRAVGADGKIYTVAGVGGCSTGGMGGPATSASLCYPNTVLYDERSNSLFIVSDSTTAVSRVILATGIIQAVAGSGSSGFAGDGGPATQAQFSLPTSIAPDPTMPDAWLIVDSQNNCVRRVSPSGVITTVIGQHGNAGTDGDGGPASSARLNAPLGIIVNANTSSVYVSDSSGGNIREVLADGKIRTVTSTTTVVNTPRSGAAAAGSLSYPQNMAWDATTGSILVMELSTSVLRWITPSKEMTSIRNITVTPAAAAGNAAWTVTLTGVALHFPLELFMDGMPCSALNAANWSHVTSHCTPTLNWNLSYVTKFGSAKYMEAGMSLYAPAPNISLSTSAASWGAAIVISAAGLGRAIPTFVLMAPGTPGSLGSLCGQLVVINGTTISCTMRVLVEAYFETPLNFLVQFSTRTPQFLSGINFTVPRPALLNVSGLPLVSLTTSTPLLVGLPHPIPTMSELTQAGDSTPCASPPIRCWIGSGSVPCQLISTQTAQLTVPGIKYSNRLLRVVVEICQRFNVTSDGLHPTANVQSSQWSFGYAIQPVVSALSPSLVFSDVASVNPNVNISIVGEGFDQTPIFGSLSFGSVACPSIVVQSPTSMLCVNWPLSQAVDILTANTNVPSMNFTGYVAFRGVSFPLGVALVIVQQPIIIDAAPSSITPGARLSIVGKYFWPVSPLPSIYLSNVACVNVTVTSAELLSCSVPASVPSSAPGYPRLAVQIITAVGAVSNTNVIVELPPDVRVTWSVPGTAVVALPSGLEVTLPFSPPLSAIITGSSPVTCTLQTDLSTFSLQTSCVTPTLLAGEASAFRTLSSVQLVGTVTSEVTIASGSNATLSLAAGMRGPMACVVALTLQCRDALARTAVSTPFTASTALIRLFWRTNGSLFTPPSNVDPADTKMLIWYDVRASTAATVLNSLACIVGAGNFVPEIGQPLTETTLLSSSTLAATYNTSVPGEIEITWPALSLSNTAFLFRTATTLIGECVWSPSGERLRLPRRVLTLSTAWVTNLVIDGTRIISCVADACVAASALARASVRGYAVTRFSGSLEDSLGSTFELAQGSCTLTHLNTSALRLVVDDSYTATVTANGSIINGLFVLQGPPQETAWLQVTCSLWDKLVLSVPFEVRSAPYDVHLGGSGSMVATWPSGPITAQLAPLTPAPMVTADAQSSITCTLTVASCVCPSVVIARGVGLGWSSSVSCSLVGETSLYISLPATTTDLSADCTFSSVGIRSPGGCIANVSANCRDGAGRSGVSNADFQFRVAEMRGDWDATYVNMVVPGLLPDAHAWLSTSEGVAWPPTASTPPVGSAWWSCTAVIFPAVTNPRLDTALTTAGALSSTSSSEITLDTSSNTTWRVVFTGLSCSACSLGQAYAFHAECAYAPTGERLRFPVLPFTVPMVNVTWRAAMPRVVRGYEAAVATLLVSSSTLPAAPPSLQCFLSLATTGTQARLTTNTWQTQQVRLGNSALATALNISFTIEAAPGTSLSLLATCTLWEQQVYSSTWTLTTATYAILPLALPRIYVPSDTAMPWFLAPAVQVAVVQQGQSAPLLDITCSLTLSRLSAADRAQVITDDADGLINLRPNEETGAVHFPDIYMQVSFSQAVVQFSVTCARDYGDGPPALLWNASIVPLRVVSCGLPTTQSPATQALPMFSYAIGVVGQDDDASACSAPSALPFSLPAISCSISLKSASNGGANSTFLQNTNAAWDAVTRSATFQQFMITAPQGQTYNFVTTCAIGSTVIPSPVLFSVELEGCPQGTQPVGVFCNPCPDNSYSVGGTDAQCTACPANGAKCAGGMISLLQHYYRPPRQAHEPLSSSSELYACLNTEACVVNASSLEYSCAEGYSGPLCSVCDASSNYAKLGAACRLCWPDALNNAFIVVASMVIFALVTMVAMRKSNQRSQASIALRITMSYIQAVGSLRVLQAGGTQAYHDVMGWTDAVSASPMSVSAVQCMWRPPYLLQYIVVISLPVLAAVAVVVVFFLGTVIQSFTVNSAERSCARMDRQQVSERLKGWWEERRYLATLFFVLFLAYMPITSASLRALDCYPQPIDGVKYLRLDMSVECGVGQHAAARVIAYVVLVVVSLGFPVGLFWLLATTPTSVVKSPAFHSTFGFLYDGYRQGTKKQHTDTAIAAPAGLQPVRGVRQSILLLAHPQVHLQSWWTRTRQVLLESVTGGQLIWWESLVLLRKAGIVLLAVLVVNPYLQSVGACAWLMLFFGLQLKMQPYTRPLFNVLESVSLGAAVATSLICMLLLQYDVTSASYASMGARSMDDTQWAITIVLVVLNLGTLCFLVGCWLMLQGQRAKGALQRVVSRSSSRGLKEKDKGLSVMSTPQLVPIATGDLPVSVNPQIPRKVRLFVDEPPFTAEEKAPHHNNPLFQAPVGTRESFVVPARPRPSVEPRATLGSSRQLKMAQPRDENPGSRPPSPIEHRFMAAPTRRLL